VKRRTMRFLCDLCMLLVAASVAGADIESGFRSPPDSARPWVYWFWLNGNITRTGITADLEAMKRVGIGGVLIMEVDQGAPAGAAAFGSPAWRELFTFMVAEAGRLGIEVNMNNDAGWCGSGGPWITPEKSMQRVVWTETPAKGPARLDALLPQPKANAGFYRDIAVLAVPMPEAPSRIPGIQGKAVFTPIHVALPARAAWPEPKKGSGAIARSGIVDLSASVGADGKIAWDVPEGAWTIFRFGHTSTGQMNLPSPQAGLGLECDKLSAEGADAAFEGLMGKVIADSPALVGEGKALVATHIDSWEVGVQNWSAKFADEFRKRRGYDPLPFLPVMTGLVVDGVEVSERFLWDLRQTIAELILDNYAGRFHERAKAHGMRLTIEAYHTCPVDELAYAGRCDEPMGEFWSWGRYGAAFSCTEMASAAHVYGKRIVGAEAFTATDGERWLGHPGNIKEIGDWAFCEGINRFVFHRYALQPWPDRRPGMSMGPWGLHYERSQTWWEQSGAWHEYLSRCQFLLQQGNFVADLCLMSPEGSPQSLHGQRAFAAGESRPGHNFDVCSPEVVLTRMSVKDGRLVLSGGMSYRMLVLPRAETMTPKLLRKVLELVKAGATIAGSPPGKSPSLSGYPSCDVEVKSLAAELWGEDPPAEDQEPRAVGKGRVLRLSAMETAAPAEPEEAASLSSARWIWRAEGRPEAAVAPGKRYFRRPFNVDASRPLKSARLVMTADNAFECWVNGKRAGAGDDFKRAYAMNIGPQLTPGANLIAVCAENHTDSPNPAGLVAALAIEYGDGSRELLVTDAAWEAAESVAGKWKTDVAAAASWSAALDVGPMGMAPWSEVQSAAESDNAIYPDIAEMGRMLEGLGVPPDFSHSGAKDAKGLRHIHRNIDRTDVYFVASRNAEPESVLCSFRVSGRCPELWWPDTGRIEAAAAWKDERGVTTLPLELPPAGSVFVVFREDSRGMDPIVRLRRDGHDLWSGTSQTGLIEVRSARYGILNDPERTKDVTAAVRKRVAEGILAFQVADLARDSDPAYGIVKTLRVEYAVDGRSMTGSATDPEKFAFTPTRTEGAAIRLTRSRDGAVEAEASVAGHYEATTQSGRVMPFEVEPIPDPVKIEGPWEVRFAPGWGAPDFVAFEKLISWSEHGDPGVRYFSGVATYSKTFSISPDLPSKQSGIYLDLGGVAVIADVKLNGKDLGTLWKAPYRVDVTGALKPGENALEVKVANLWVNRQIGDELLPEDSERNGNGTLKAWPAWLAEDKPSPPGRYTFTSWRLWNKDSPLQPSGLLGPVTLECVRRAVVVPP
jgi:hypothetical protein